MPEFDLDAALSGPTQNSLSNCQLYARDWHDGSAHVYADVGQSFLFIGKLHRHRAQTPYDTSGMRLFDTRQDAISYLLQWASRAFDNGWTTQALHYTSVMPPDAYKLT